MWEVFWNIKVPVDQVSPRCSVLWWCGHDASPPPKQTGSQACIQDTFCSTSLTNKPGCMATARHTIPQPLLVLQVLCMRCTGTVGLSAHPVRPSMTTLITSYCQAEMSFSRVNVYIQAKICKCRTMRHDSGLKICTMHFCSVRDFGHALLSRKRFNMTSPLL